MRFRLITMLAAVVALAPIAACGDSIDKNAYVKDVSSIQQATQTEFNEITAEMGKSKSTEQSAKKLGELATALETNADRLAAVGAPGDVEDIHKRYVQLYRDFAVDLEALAGRLSGASSTEIKAIMKDTGKVTSELATDEQQIVDQINTTLQG